MGMQNPRSNGPAAIILAAGASRRMGSPKALLDLGGQPVISHVVQVLQQVRELCQIIVVTGHQPELIQRALGGSPVTFTHNPNYDTGQMLSSVKCGVESIPHECPACFLTLLDQPLVEARTYDALWSAWNEGQPPLLVPAFQRSNGHPILIATRCIPEILSLPPTGSLRDFVDRHRAQMQVVEVDDPGVVTDLDTPEDYQSILARRKK